MESLSEEQGAYVEEMGLFVERNGAQRTVGRVMAALLISDRPMTQENLMQLLGLSRTSASTALKWLEQFGIVQQKCQNGQRKHFYGIRSDIVEWSSRTTFRHLQDEFRLFRQGEEVAEPESREMLHKMCELIGFLNQRLEAALTEWIAAQDGGQPTVGGSEPARRLSVQSRPQPPAYS